MGFILGFRQIAMQQSLVSVIINRLRIAVAAASEQADQQQKGCATDDHGPHHTAATARFTLFTNEHSTLPLIVRLRKSPMVPPSIRIEKARGNGSFESHPSSGISKNKIPLSDHSPGAVVKEGLSGCLTAINSSS
jgi:hypothetical protein